MARGAPGEVLSRWGLVSRRSARRGISLIARRRQGRPQRRHGMGDRGDGRVRRYLLTARQGVVRTRPPPYTQAKPLRSLMSPSGAPIEPQRWPQCATPVGSAWEAREGPSRCNRQRSLCMLQTRGIGQEWAFRFSGIEDREVPRCRSTCTPRGREGCSSAVGPGGGKFALAVGR